MTSRDQDQDQNGESSSDGDIYRSTDLINALSKGSRLQTSNSGSSTPSGNTSQPTVEPSNIAQQNNQTQSVPEPQHTPPHQRIYSYECLKCGTKVTSTIYRFKETISTTKSNGWKNRTRALDLPVCPACKSEFEAWESKYMTERWTIGSIIRVFCFAFILLIGGIFGSIFAVPAFRIVPILFAIAGSLILIIGSYYIVKQRTGKKLSNNP